MGLKGVLRTLEGGDLAFWCPGCEEAHTIAPAIWSFGGDYDKPTFSPSVLVTNGHYTARWQPGSPCWCTYNAAHPDDPAPFRCRRCHSFVTNGKIQFLGDSTHALAGQTVPMQPCGEQ